MEIEYGYYQINGTKKILYFDGERRMKPVKDRQKRFGSLVEPLDKQPTNIKTITPVEETEYASLYRLW